MRVEEKMAELAAVVRESIERYCLGPEAEKSKKEALRKLFGLGAPVPDEYSEWETEYSLRKTAARDHERSEEQSEDERPGG